MLLLPNNIYIDLKYDLELCLSKTHNVKPSMQCDWRHVKTSYYISVHNNIYVNSTLFDDVSLKMGYTGGLEFDLSGSLKISNCITGLCIYHFL